MQDLTQQIRGAATFAQAQGYYARYQALNQGLIDAGLTEEQRKVAQRQKEIEALKAELKEQRSIIQKVSDRIELKSSTSRVTANDQ